MPRKFAAHVEVAKEVFRVLDLLGPLRGRLTSSGRANCTSVVLNRAVTDRKSTSVKFRTAWEVLE